MCQVILILFNTDLNTENNISFVKTILKTLLITVNFAHIFRGGTLSKIPLRPVLIQFNSSNISLQKKNYVALKGMIIAHHHTPTWSVACNFSPIYSLWISWWGVQLSNTHFSYAKAESHTLVFHMLKPADPLSILPNIKIFSTQ